MKQNSNREIGDSGMEYPTRFSVRECRMSGKLHGRRGEAVGVVPLIRHGIGEGILVNVDSALKGLVDSEPGINTLRSIVLVHSPRQVGGRHGRGHGARVPGEGGHGLLGTGGVG